MNIDLGAEIDIGQIRSGEQEMERRILRGLTCEWRHAVLQLPDAQGSRMRAPVFTLREYGQRWGSWDRARREIGICKRLAWDRPWACVRDVLLHEMAHQMADEVWGGDATANGDFFRRACQLLRADPNATAEYSPLTDGLPQQEISDNDRILLRVKKLLALAQSANPHEAEAAMAKAHEQIARYNVDLLSARPDRGYCSLCIGQPAPRRFEHDRALALLLCDFYFVEGIWISTYVLEKARMGSVLEISGLPENVKMADYAHGFLHRVIEDQWRAFNADGRHSHQRKIDFAVGIIRGFRQKLESQEAQWQTDNGSTWALIRAGDARLAQYFRTRYPRIRRISGRPRRIDLRVQNAGHKVGRETVLSRPLEGANGGRKHLLGT